MGELNRLDCVSFSARGEIFLGVGIRDERRALESSNVGIRDERRELESSIERELPAEAEPGFVFRLCQRSSTKRRALSLKLDPQIRASL